MIAIPNMEKPRSCDGCNFVKFWVNGSFYCMADGEELNVEADIRGDCPLLDIVTCGECKWYEPYDSTRPYDCPRGMRQVNADDFCSYGERRSE